MKILHTSDWHLGKRLHQVDLTEDHRHFTEWLLKKVKEEQVDLVLVSGDVFGLANPSSEARKIYYEINGGNINYRNIDIPTIRRLKRITGNLEQVRYQMEQTSKEESLRQQLPEAYRSYDPVKLRDHLLSLTKQLDEYIRLSDQLKNIKELEPLLEKLQGITEQGRKKRSQLTKLYSGKDIWQDVKKLRERVNRAEQNLKTAEKEFRQWEKDGETVHVRKNAMLK